MVHLAVSLKATILGRNHSKIVQNKCKKLAQIAPSSMTAFGTVIKQRNLHQKG